MTITYPLSLPNTTSFRSVTFRPASVVAVSQSPFSKKQQVHAHPGDQWVVEVTLRPMVRADAEDWISLWLKLNGAEGTLLIGDRTGATPRGSWAGAPVVDGAAQTGKSFNVKGFTASQTNVARVGSPAGLVRSRKGA